MASITEKELVAALKELLPPLDPEIVTLGTMKEKLAVHFGVDPDDLKARKSELKGMIADWIHLCEGGDNKENEGGADENASEEEEEEEPVARKKKPVAKRSRAIHESDDEDDGGDNESDEDEHSEAGDDDDSEDEKPKRRKKAAAPAKKQKTAAKPSATKRKAPVTKAADKAKDSEGIASLKELARVAGLMGPAVYSQLKKAGSEEEQEAILRERLDEGGVRFSGSYPKKSDITAAKKKKDKERELDGIDTSLIISGGRPRRGAAQRASYVEKYEDEDEDEELEKGEGQEENGDEGQQEEDDDEESEAHVESDASDDSEAEF